MPVYPSGGTIAQSAGSPGFGPAPAPSFNASGSVRFNPADTAYISFTPTLQGSRTTWTWSGWVKRSGLSTLQNLFSVRVSNETTIFRLETNNTLLFFAQNSTPTTTANYTTASVLRDVSAWYHVLVAIDTTQPTAADRVKIYVNGVLQTLTTTTAVAQYAQLFVNTSGYLHGIGFQNNFGEYFNGYLADINFVDGLALTPSSFTSTDSNTGQLVPAQYTGNRGLNGFYLPFSGAALAADLGQNQKTTGQDYPQWPYNTLLVDTTNTNGQQNNTFLDSSTNNFTVTRNGNTTQGNFSPFTFGGGTTQANGYYSGYFDGTGDYLTYPGSAFTGNFTCEFWFFSNSGTATTVGAWISSVNASVIGYLPTEDRVLFSSSTDASANYTNQITSTATFPSRTWTHYAFTRSGSTTTLYVNGRSVGTGTYSGSLNFNFIARQASYTPRDFNGYISNFRVTNTVVYTSNFTPTTTPLTAISGTQVLTCQSSQFIDNSANAYTVSAFANSQPVPTNPFGMTDWSGYFDGTGDDLTTPSNAAFTYGTGDFTIEGFFFFTGGVGPSGYSYLFGQGGAPATSTSTLGLYTQAGVYRVWNGSQVISGTTAFAQGQWVHIALTRSGTSLRLFVNGVLDGSATNSNSIATGGTIGISVGRWAEIADGNWITGYISNFRVVKGTALYTSNFTVPTSPLTAITGTSLLTCQSSTFIDNSPNAFAITVNGNSYTSTLNNPFNSQVNTTPPVQAWSAYNPINSAFEPARGYITLPTSTNLALGSGDFCVEFFVYSSVGYGMSNAFCGNFFSAGAGAFYIDTSTNSGAVGPVSVRFANTDGLLITSPVMLRLNQWFHIAVCRTAGTLSMFINGNRVGSVANTYNFSNGTGMELFRGNINAPNRAPGYMSNFRLVKGRSPYNAGLTTLTVPTEPLQAIPGTQLLALQSNQLVDNSPNRFPLTLVTVEAPGITPVTPNSPFLPTTAYSAASNGGSMYFDGTGDFLTVPNNAAFDLGSGNATIEAWVFPASSGQTCGIFDKRSVGTNYSQFPQVALVSGAFVAYVSYTGSSWAGTINGATPAVNTWTHVAFVRNGNTWTLYVNGVVSGTPFTAAGSVYTSTDNLVIGASTTAGLNPINGYIANARIIKGTALYTTPFVPPVLPPTNISNTSLLLNATNSGIYDATGKNVIETVGNAQVSTAVKKFGESSMYFDGSGDYLVIPPRVELYLSTNQQLSYTNKDFTIEFWMYPTTVGSSQAIITRRSSQTARGFIVSISSGGVLFVGFGDASTAAWEYSFTSSAGAIAANTWQHVAVTRLGATYRTFVNGALLNSAAPSAFLVADDTSPIWIGQNGNEASPSPFNGYLQDVRFTIGAARYQGAFTPPAAAFAYNQYDIGNQQWLPNNISVTAGINQDNLVDSPSDYGTDTGLGGQVRGNYCTLNAAAVGITALSNGNLQFNYNATYSAQGTIGVTSGKWYFEGILTTQVTAEQVIGVVNQSWVNSTTLGANANGWGIIVQNNANNGQAYHNGSVTSSYATFANGDIAMVAFDVDSGKIWFGRNGTWFNSGAPASGTGQIYSNLSGTIFPAFNNKNNSGGVLYANFGQRAFAYAAPAGFKCLVSTNLPTTNNIGATSTTRASNYFNANLWTGYGTQIPVGFDPSLIWYKSTNAVGGAGWVDQIRGDNYYMLTYNTLASTLFSGLLTTNSTGFVPGSAFASNTYVGYSWRGADTLSWSFDGSLERTATMTIASPCVVTLASNGFSPGQAVRFTTTGALPTGIVAGTTYYAGNMVGSTFNLYDTEANAITGGATGRVNTSGSQSGTQTCEHAAKISANPTSGFSVTQYIGVGGTTTVPHGLGTAPEMYIIKCASTTGNWLVLTTALDGSVDYAYLNGQQNLTNAGAGFSTLPTSTVVSLGTDPDANTNGVTYMLYSYVSIPGFSKVGVYTGNGAADGPMIYTNFSPEMMLLKRVSGTPIDNWYNLDVPRSPYNVVSNYLIPNSDQAQNSATFVDFLSNGFKVRAAGANENAAGSSYLYLAIASAPFKYSRAY